MPKEQTTMEALASLAEVAERGKPRTVKLEGVTAMSFGGGSIGPLPVEGTTVEVGMEIWEPEALEASSDAARSWIQAQRDQSEALLASAPDETAEVIRGNLLTLDDYAEAIDRDDTSVIKVLSELQWQTEDVTAQSK